MSFVGDVLCYDFGHCPKYCNAVISPEWYYLFWLVRVSILSEGLVASLDLPRVNQDTVSKSQNSFSRVESAINDFFHSINTKHSFRGKLGKITYQQVGRKIVV